MFISITHFRLNSVVVLPLFFTLSILSILQAKKSKGLVSSSVHSTGLHDYWTMTCWDEESSMLAFRNQGSHRSAMKYFRLIGYGWVGRLYKEESLPWPKAIEWLNKHGQLIT